MIHYVNNLSMLTRANTRQIILLIALVASMNVVKAMEPEALQQRMDVLEVSADVGDREAQRELGYIYIENRELENNYEHAVKWLTMAAEQGSPRAQLTLAQCHRKGRGTERDEDTAIMYYKVVLSNPEATTEHLTMANEALESMQKNEKQMFYSGVVTWVAQVGELLAAIF